MQSWFQTFCKLQYAGQPYFHYPHAIWMTKNFMDAVQFILLQSADKFPASVRICQYFRTGGLIGYGSLAAYSVIYMIPCVILYAFAQKYMSRGFALGGADKG